MFIPEVRLEQTVSFTTPRETFAHALLTRARLSMMDLSSAARSTNPLTHRMYYMQTGSSVKHASVRETEHKLETILFGVWVPM